MVRGMNQDVEGRANDWGYHIYNIELPTVHIIHDNVISHDLSTTIYSSEIFEGLWSSNSCEKNSKIKVDYSPSLGATKYIRVDVSGGLLRCTSARRRDMTVRGRSRYSGIIGLEVASRRHCTCR